jgi:predicted nucleotidyltransferase
VTGPSGPSGQSGSSDDLAAASPAQGALDEVLHAALALARTEPSVHAIALVGSCARGTPGPESDVDLVILSTDPDDLCQRGDWVSHFGSVTLVGQRQFGDVTERRLRRGDGVDIEIGLAPLSWAETHPVDAGTARVVREGFSIVFDPHGTLAGLVGPVGLVGPAAAVGPAADVRDNQ